jgi:GTPase SAR1 family protein
LSLRELSAQLIVVVGASGVGKDTLIQAWMRSLPPEQRPHVARRVITREQHPSEDHDRPRARGRQRRGRPPGPAVSGGRGRAGGRQRRPAAEHAIVNDCAGPCWPAVCNTLERHHHAPRNGIGRMLDRVRHTRGATHT